MCHVSLFHKKKTEVQLLMQMQRYKTPNGQSVTFLLFLCFSYNILWLFNSVSTLIDYLAPVKGMSLVS